MNLTVKHACLSDAENILAITKEAFKKYTLLAKIDTTAALEESISDVENDINSKIVLSAFVDGEFTGSVRLELLSENKAYLSRFGVSSKFQSHGIGNELLKAVDVEMKKNKISELHLHTASKVESLIKFYYSNGFFIDSTTKDKGYVRALLIKEY